MTSVYKKNIALLLTLSIFTSSCSVILNGTGMLTEKEIIETKIEINKKLVKKEYITPVFNILGRNLTLTLKTGNTYSIEKNQVINFKNNLGWLWNIGAFILDAGLFTLAFTVLPFHNPVAGIYSGAAIGVIDLLFGNLSANRGHETKNLSKDFPVEEIPLSFTDIKLKLGNIILDGYTNELGTVLFYFIPPFDYSSFNEGTILINNFNEKPVEIKFSLSQNLKTALQELSSGKSSSIKLSGNISQDKTPPEITIFEPPVSRGLRITGDSEKISIKGKAEDVSGISRININDTDIFFDRDGNFSSEIFLKSGENNIEISATDNYQNKSVKSFQVIRKTTQPNPSLQGWYKKQYALVIGIDYYKTQSMEKLENAVNDAKAVSQVLKDMGFEVTELYNEKAGKKEIIDNIAKITKISVNEDSFIFYFAGHGQGISLVNKQKVGYVIPYDADIGLSESDLIRLNQEAISLTDLRTYFQNMKSKHIALLLDSCFSGLALKRSVPSLINTNIEYYKDLLTRKAINILTAGDDQPVSDGTGHSPFTQALLNGLEKKGIDIQDRDGFATFTELAVYVKEKVEKATNRRQRPQFDNFIEEDGDFIFKIR